MRDASGARTTKFQVDRIMRFKAGLGQKGVEVERVDEESQRDVKTWLIISELD